MIRRHFNLVAFFRFCFRKKALKMLNFQAFYSKEKPLVVILSEMLEHISRKYKAQKGVNT